MKVTPLDQDISAVPTWLQGDLLRFTPETALKFFASRVVYYPGSGCNWAPVELFARSAHCFVYADYMVELAGVPSIPGFTVVHSEDLNATALSVALGWGGDDLPPVELLTELEEEWLAGRTTGLLSGRWSIWEQSGVPYGEVQRRIALLQIRGEAVRVFQGLWGLKSQGSGPYGLYTGHDLGNWTSWCQEGQLFAIAARWGAWPMWYRCFDGRGWPTYDRQFNELNGGVLNRRTAVEDQLLPARLFEKANKQGPLTEGEEEKLAVSEFWFERYDQYLEKNHRVAFLARIDRWFLKGWISLVRRLDHHLQAHASDR